LTHIFNITFKEIYTILIQGKLYERKSENYWAKKFNDTDFDFLMLYKKSFVCKITPRNILDFNWRIFNGQVITENKLMLMKLSDGICKCCHI